MSLRNLVRIGKETVRGTAVIGTLTVPTIGDGLKIGLTNHLGKIRPSSTYPNLGYQQSLGLTPAAALSPLVNINTVRDLINMAFARTAGVLPSLTIEETSEGVDSQKASGCVCSKLALSFQRSATPNEAALLAAQLEFAAMKIAAATGVTAGSQGSGHHFSLAQGTYTINSVASLWPTNWGWTLTNIVQPGPHLADRSVEWIQEGDAAHEFDLTGRFSTAAWRDLVKNATDHTCVFVLATGTSGETITLTLTNCQVESHTLSEDGPTTMQAIKISPLAVSIAFGAGIGASVLSL
jgi:hypothetical protein